jgi:hypothetical protein
MALNIPSLVVSAVTTFDGKGLAQGQKAISGFEKTAKNLARTLGVSLSAAAVVAFGKASVKAFAEDEQAAKRLSTTVNNLGLSFENARITKFIADLEKTANVSDDVLRPAFSALLTTTGSVTKSQKLLALSLDVAAGSGEDAVTVAGDLSRAYVGNTKGLTKYNLGLTKAELAGKSFNEIQELIAKQFAGQNAARLDTYTGKMDALKVASDNAKETIGKGLVDALAILGGQGVNDIEAATKAMDDLASSTSDVIRGQAVVLKNLAGLFDGKAGKLGNAIKIYFKEVLGIQALEDLGKKAISPKAYGPNNMPAYQPYSPKQEEANAKARAKAEADAAKRAKELLALQKKQALAEKNKIALSKAAAVFDTTRISLAAALQATYDKETKLRLEALMLIEEDKGEEALKKITQLANFQKSADLQRLAGVETISNATLDALNTQLITELGVINRSKLAEGDKELAREEAFKKYNAAITAAGSLAAKESYNERVQIQLTEIARLASISSTYNAQATAALLLESSELSMIDRIAKAQAEADAKRLASLKQYTDALNSVATGRDYGGNILGTPVPNFTPYITTAPSTTMGPFASTLTEPPKLTPTPSYSVYDPFSKYDAPAANVTINAGIGDPEAIARAVEDVLNQSTYRGTSVNRGSGRYYE